MTGLPIRRPRTAGRTAPRVVGLVVGLAVAIGVALADQVGAAPQPPPRKAHARTFIIRAGTIHTVAGTPLRGGEILVRGTQIVAVGRRVRAPKGTRVHVYPAAIVTPGLIDAATSTGLREIALESSTVDNEAADRHDPVRAGFRAADAFFPRSPALAIARANGITSIVAVPVGGLVSGHSLWADLRGPPGEARVLRSRLAVNAHLGAAAGRSLGGSRGHALLRLRELFDEARLYADRKEAFRDNRLNELRASEQDLQALLPILERRTPLVLRAHRADDIERAVLFGQEQKVRVIVTGATEAHLVTRSLRRAAVPVIVDPLDSLPADFERLRARQDNATRLHRRGVTVILSGQDAFDSRYRVQLLRLLAGNAVRFGLPWPAALEAVTVAPARAFGMEQSHGQVRPGRLANLVVWSGDPFEISTRVLAVYVRGRRASLFNRQRELLRRYRTVPVR